MNWTGGSLQRTKNANKGVVQKQKAFFARARTHLQNGSKLPVKPFRPSYLQNDDNFGLSEHPFGSGHVHTIERSNTRLHEAMCRGISPEGERPKSTSSMIPTYEEDQVRALERVHSGITHRTHDLEGKQRRKRKTDETDPEAKLLEANRKRLLKQSDWIGATHSQPVSLHFWSSKEKSKFGRRRRVESKTGVTPRYSKQVEPVTDRWQYHRGSKPGAAPVGAIHIDRDNVRIRIGTDALTTACSTQPNGQDRSQGSSDAMLFDQQTRGADRPDALRALQSNTFRDYTHDTASHQSHEDSDYDQACIDEQVRPDFYSPRPIQSNALCDNRGTYESATEHATPMSAGGYRTKSISASRRDASTPRIMQQLGKIKHPLRLVFGESKSSAGSHPARQDDSTRGTEHAPLTADVSASQTGSVHRFGGRRGSNSGGETMAGAIVDEQPWKSFLDIFDKGSSQTSNSSDSQMSTMHHNPSKQDREHECTSWSQHATQGQQTHLSSSLVSASLPSLKRQAQTRARAHGLTASRDRRIPMDSRVLNDDERLWQEYVFGDDDVLSSEIINGHSGCGDNKLWRHSSGYIRPSIAVSSVSSTPFRRGLGCGPRLSNGVHDAVKFAPPSGTRTISSASAMPAGFIQELSGKEQGDEERAECSACGEQSVTHASHASLLNNASGDAGFMSSRMFGHTETSCSGLEHVSYRDGSNSSRTRWHPEQFSARDMLDSEEDGLDLVDANRL